MTCQDFVAFVIDYVEGGLPEPVRARFVAHLGECPDCVRYLADYEAAIHAGRAIADDDLRAEAPDALVRAIREARPDLSGE